MSVLLSQAEYLTEVSHRGGYIDSAILLIVLYSFLDIRTKNTTMAISYYVKIVLTFFGIIGALAFATFIRLGKTRIKRRDTAAVTEWITACIFIAFMASFVFEMLAFPRPASWPSDTFS